jgi:hypothetical protein
MNSIAAAQDPDDVVAHHEAGHAVASYVLRDFLGTVTIDSPDEMHAGGTKVWTLTPPLVDDSGLVVTKDKYTENDLDDFEAAVVIATAGPLAETMYWTHRTYDEVLMQNKRDEAQIMTITRKIWPEDAAGAHQRLRSRAQALLQTNWSSVQRLAAVLEDKRTLAGPEAIALIL